MEKHLACEKPHEDMMAMKHWFSKLYSLFYRIFFLLIL